MLSSSLCAVIFIYNKYHLSFRFFDTSEEGQRTREMQHEFRPVTVEELEGKRRKDIEQALIKRDVKRQKIQENHDVPGALAKAAEVNDPVMVRRRGRMMLPAPQISEVELEHIARMSTDAMLDEQVWRIYMYMYYLKHFSHRFE